MSTSIPNLSNIPYIHPIKRATKIVPVEPSIIIALVAYEQDIFIELSEKLVTPMSHFKLGYQSVPHIKITEIPHKFNPNIHDIAYRIKKLQINLFPHTLNFNKLFSVAKGKFIWLNLYPTDPEYCIQIREQVLSTFQNGIGEPYQEPFHPHMKIARLSDPLYAEVALNETPIALSSAFYLAYGYKDEIGQLTDILEEL